MYFRHAADGRGARSFIIQRVISSECTPLLAIWLQYSVHQRNLYGAIVL